MSRAFVKEDVDVPEPEKVCEFRAYSGRSRFEIEPNVVKTQHENEKCHRASQQR